MNAEIFAICAMRKYISLPEGSEERPDPWHRPNWEKTLQEKTFTFTNYFHKLVSPDGTRELLISIQASHRPFGDPQAARSGPRIRSGQRNMNILLIINPGGDVNTDCGVQHGYIIIHGVGMAVMMGGEHETMNNKV